MQVCNQGQKKRRQDTEGQDGMGAAIALLTQPHAGAAQRKSQHVIACLSQQLHVQCHMAPIQPATLGFDVLRTNPSLSCRLQPGWCDKSRNHAEIKTGNGACY
jgi:hypothetical protein